MDEAEKTRLLRMIAGLLADKAVLRVELIELKLKQKRGE